MLGIKLARTIKRQSGKHHSLPLDLRPRVELIYKSSNSINFHREYNWFRHESFRHLAPLHARADWESCNSFDCFPPKSGRLQDASVFGAAREVLMHFEFECECDSFWMTEACTIFNVMFHAKILYKTLPAQGSTSWMRFHARCFNFPWDSTFSTSLIKVSLQFQAKPCQVQSKTRTWSIFFENVCWCRKLN